MDFEKKLYGVYRAVVHSNKDPNNLRRLKVKVTTTGEQITNWIFPMVSTQKPPAIGTGVYIFYVGGDPEYPVWIGEFSKNPQGLFAFGSWANTSDLTASINTPTAVTFNATSFEKGIKLQNSSKLVIEESGVYNIQFSAQFHHISGGGAGETVFMWFRKNGTNIANSATTLHISSNTYDVMTVNLFESMKPNDYFQVYWSTTNANIRVEHVAANAVHPAIPSIIVTVNQIA